MENQADIHLLLGRLDGKMDMILSNQSSQSDRISHAEERLSDVETDVTKLKTHQASKTQFVSWMLSGIAVFISCIPFVKH